LDIVNLGDCAISSINRELFKRFLYNYLITIVRGQSTDKEFLLLLEPPALATYAPVIKSTTPLPPLVPGNQAAITALDC
jgi:hypothetical protein